MARARKKITDPTPITILLWILSSIGKPVYRSFSKTSKHLRSFIVFIIQSTPKIKLEFLRINLLEIKIFRKIFKRRKKKLRIKKRYILLSLVAIILLSTYFYVLKDLPSPHDLSSRKQDISTKIYDRNGNLLYKIYRNENRTVIPLSKIPLQLRLATLAAEDAEFYNHPGFSIRGIFRSLIENIGAENLQGGSTITQQLIKNTLLTPEKTVQRKLKELVLSIETENSYTKDQILEMYLNEVSYGGTAYGVAEASQVYFGKGIDEINLAESALLAGLPKSPSHYSPLNTDPKNALSRQKEVLRLMKINKFITNEQFEEAVNTKLNFANKKIDIKAPHFVMYVRQKLVEKYGEEVVEKGGLEVTTSLDLSIQNLAEDIVKKEVDKLKNLHVGNGAAIVLKPDTGEVLAMVGSKDYFDIKNDGNVNVMTQLRQPGSSIKLVNYAYALSHEYNPASIIDDSPITYVIPGSKPYTPKNYDGQFVGKINLRNAFAQSRNIPAVKILASYGVDKMIEQGKKMGITTWEDSKNYGLSLTLGGGAVKGIDLAKAYATIANLGKSPEILSILQVKDHRGKLIEKNSLKNTSVIDPRVSYQIIDILKDNNARAPEFGFNSALNIKDHPEVAVKTGTSNDLRDNWTVGFNQKYLVLTWVGNNDNSPMSRIASGITGASPIWNKIMASLLKDETSINWQIPSGIVTSQCNGKPEYFLQERVQINFCKPTPTPDTTTNPSRIL